MMHSTNTALKRPTCFLILYQNTFHDTYSSAIEACVPKKVFKHGNRKYSIPLDKKKHLQKREKNIDSGKGI